MCILYSISEEKLKKDFLDKEEEEEVNYRQMAKDLQKNMTDEEQAKALGMSLDEFLNYKKRVVNAYKVGIPLVAQTGRPVTVNVDQQTTKVVSIVQH